MPDQPLPSSPYRGPYVDPLREEYRHAFVDNPRRQVDLANHAVALVCIDVQYLDASPHHGIFADPVSSGISDDAAAYYFDRLDRTVLPNMRKLQDSFRLQGMEVIHCRICSLTRDGRDRSAGHKRLGLLAQPGSKDAEFIPMVAPQGDEIIINKTASGVFSSTNFHYLLHNLGIRSLFLCGVYTNECVETTARDACDLGYFVTLVDDACATVTPELHRASIATLRDRYARIALADEVIVEVETLAASTGPSRDFESIPAPS